MKGSFYWVWLSVIAALVSLPAVGTGDPWENPFSGDARTVLEAAQNVRVPDDQAVVILLEDHLYVIDASGRMVSKVRKVFRILKQEGVDEWASVEQPYEPWHENRPELRARVITADGRVHWLDPKTIADSPAHEYDSSIFSDRRVLRAPLPAVAAGAVVEYEIVVRENAPLLDAGVTRRIIVPDYVPIQRVRVLVEAPKSVPLQTAARLIPATAIRQHELGSMTRVQCEFGPISARKEFEPNLPSDLPDYPYFSFSTGGSWQKIAARYEEIVEKQIASADLRPLLAGMDLSGGGLTVATRLAAKLHKEIRYTGVEFGEAAIVPRMPAEVLQRRYGDCKDKAALLVAMLRAAGLNAHVALLSSGFGTDVDTELPGLGLFDHAIVYLAGEGPLWIDATAAETRIGELPLGAQGRLALVASGRTTALVRTPESQAADNWRRHTIEVRMSDFGRGEFHEALEAHGSLETQMRQIYDGGDEQKLKEALEQYVKKDLLAKSLGRFAATKKDDLTQSFRLDVQAKESRRAVTVQDEAAAIVFPYLVFQELPYTLRFDFEDQRGKEEKPPRKNDFVLTEPHQVEYRYKIFPPPSFKPKALPPSVEFKLGAALYSRTFQTNPDGTVEVVFRFSTEKRRLSPADFQALREGLRLHAKEVPEAIIFVSEANAYVALGETGKALKLVRENAAIRPDQVAPKVRLSRLLVTAGAVESAINVAKKAIEQEPASSQAWQALAWAYQHDSFGRRFHGNWNRPEAERCYREALKQDGEEEMARIDLAILLEHNGEGERYAKGAQLEEAVALYREVLKSSPNPVVQQNLVIALLHSGRYPEVKDELKTLAPDVQAVLSIVVTAISESPARAIVEAQASFPDEGTRVRYLASASQTLLQLRHYNHALEMLKAVMRISDLRQLRAQLELLSKLKRHEDALYPPTDPRYPVQQLLIKILSARLDLSSLKSLFTKRETWRVDSDSMAKLKREIAGGRALFGSLGLTHENSVDFVVSLLEMQTEGDDAHGYRIRGARPQSASLPVMYVVREEEEYRILGSRDSLEHIGELVLELLGRKDIKAAQWWLDHVVTDLRPDTPEGTGGPAARFLWSGVTAETRGPQAIAVAAASLIGRDSVSEKAIQILNDARARSVVQIEGAQLDLALCESLEKAQKWEALLVAARRLGSLRTFSGDSFRYVAKALAGLNRWKELRAAAELRLKSAPHDLAALRAVARAMVRGGNREGAVEQWKKVTASPLARLEDRLFEAWNCLLIGKVDDNLLTRLDGVGETSGQLSSAYWYTLGMLQVSLGRPDEAKRSLVRALDQDDFTVLDAKAWVLSGKIYEQYGLLDAAGTAYEKARSKPPTDEMAEWALSLVVTSTPKQVDKTRPASALP